MLVARAKPQVKLLQSVSLADLALIVGAAIVLLPTMFEVGKFNWKGVLFVCGSTALFAFLLIPAGLIIALIVLCLVSAAASHFFKFEWKAVAALVVLVVFCALVFAKGLGVPMPLLGTWLGG